MCRLFTIVFLLTPLLLVGQNKVVFEPTPVNFTIKNAGFNVHGSIDGLEGYVMIEGSSPVKIEGTIDPNTIHTGIDLRDSHLKKSDYFNVKKYSEIKMSSESITRRSKNKYVGKFSLTIKDITKRMEIPFNFSDTGDGYVLKGEFAINRLDFKVGDKSITLAEDVKIKIEFKAPEKK